MANTVVRRKATPGQIEGPYWKPNSPARTDLREPGVVGEPITLQGRVVDFLGRPLAGVWLDFWQADGNGDYDMDGYRLRGHQFTGEDGAFTLQTIIPGEYEAPVDHDDGPRAAHRTPHIHVKMKHPKRSTVTTQLYFPGEPFNDGDAYFRPECLLRMDRTAEGLVGRHELVVASS